MNQVQDCSICADCMVLDSQFYISISITVAHKYGISMQDNQSNIWHCLGVLLICVSYILGTSPNNAMKGSDGSTCLKNMPLKCEDNPNGDSETLENE